ncbi:MAG: 3-ketoacyl-CoA thiolase [Bacteroidetes bacterium RIFOXYA12_FULL_35_11]|nr:MAG: 3-ketoacyl-CoA thiolase [Bacteroidetes bacterium GWF2_35_48]OFY76279.1 MAG: 3-ketoacyl-CoA thiolase [Bacteroidetes bacterium RIFOXYA12_FULL_35_11]OFY96524.1 MAG: 3-ketoacyl-CoA thiolase [Bacteroidetes bacterium RIFOXYB2_FULL_35_7]OFZ04017.1 MAG: 3-ketoacyl-CoA thiolase [Bacteroidetes bacterium RIFOXYC12_FULL_35_7]HBX52689.1 3-ketoacyl-CoA thiolase [Bacteroidales bacterium]
MTKLRRKIYMVAGYNTISMGSGRKEFHPKKERPGLEEYIKEAGQGVLKAIGGAKNVDETVFGNFIASRFNRQANIAGFAPFIDEGLKYKPATRVEGACATGALALVAGIKSVLAETAEVVLVVGVEVQNTVKAIYGADILAAAGWAKERKDGHAYFFPGKFSDRSKAYAAKFGAEKTREAMAKWFTNAIENARLCPTAQEYHNTTKDLVACGMVKPNPKGFVDSLNVFDCSKVSDGASAIAIVSEEGLKRCGISKADAVEVMGLGQAEDDITRTPEDITVLGTTKAAVTNAFASACITKDKIGTVECHDCFTIAGIMAIEAIGFAEHGKGTEFVLAGNTTREGMVPFNTTGGLIGWGHPTGATGVHQAVTLWEQLTGKAAANQITFKPERPYGLSINMGGDDKTLVSIVYKKAE